MEQKLIQLQDGTSILTVSASDINQNLKKIIELLDQGVFVELRKRNRKVGMIVPY